MEADLENYRRNEAEQRKVGLKARSTEDELRSVRDELDREKSSGQYLE